MALCSVPSVHSLCSSRRPSFRCGRPMAQSWVFFAHATAISTLTEGSSAGRSAWPRRLFPTLLLHAQTPQTHATMSSYKVPYLPQHKVRHGGTPVHGRTPARPFADAELRGEGKRANLPGPRDPRDEANTNTCASLSAITWSLMDAPVSTAVIVLLCVSSVMNSVALRS